MREAKGVLRRLLAAALRLIPVRAVIAVLVGHGKGDVLFAVRTHELRVSQARQRRCMYAGETGTTHLLAAAVVARAAVEVAMDAVWAAAVDSRDFASLRKRREAGSVRVAAGDEQRGQLYSQ